MDNKIPIDISKDSDYISVQNLPLEKQHILSLCDFYQYKMANTNDSPLSLKIDTVLNNSQKDVLFNKILDAVNIEESDILFNSMLRNKIKEIRAMELSDTTLRCNKIKGFFHQKNQSCSQHKIDAMFKHIRDSFAHGRIALDGNFLILEDKVNELTGRLVVTIDALLIWKKVIEKYLFDINFEEA